MTAETIEPATADAVVAPLDLLLTDAALGALNRVYPGGSGLRLVGMMEPVALPVRYTTPIFAIGTDRLKGLRGPRWCIRMLHPGWA